MSKQEVKQESRVKSVRKSWYKILAPQVFGQREVGETYLTTPENAVGRTLRYNLKELTGNVKDQNISLLLKIDKVAGTTLHTIPVGYELAPSSVKRMVKKNTTRLDDYCTAISRDGKKVIIKSVLITSIKIQRAVGKALKKVLHDMIQEDLSRQDVATFTAELAGGKIRNELRKRLTKIYPLREAAIRSVTIAGSGEPPAPVAVPTPVLQSVPEQDHEVTAESADENAAAALPA